MTSALPEPSFGSPIAPELIGSIRRKLERGRKISRALPDGGWIMMDRPLPFICLYRVEGTAPDPGVDRLLRGQTAYLRSTASPARAAELRQLLAAVAGALTITTDAFLLIELWPAAVDAEGRDFRAYCPVNNAPEVAAVLDRRLKEVAAVLPGATAEVVDSVQRHPPHLAPVFSVEELRKLGILNIGIEIPRVYWTADGLFSTLALRSFRSRLTDAIQRTAQAFMRVQTPLRFAHHLMLGRTTIRRSAAHIDRKLAAIGASFDLLLNVSPVNTAEAWQAFRAGGFEKMPDLHYRLIGVDPDRVKQQLYALRIGEVDDGTLESIFRDKRFELDTQLSLLSERGRPEFVYSGLRLYGPVSNALLKEAHALIAAVDRLPERKFESMGAARFAERVEQELALLRPHFPDIPIGVQLRTDVDGVMVSKGQVLIGDRFKVEVDRAEGLVQHEVGTHVLTYCNGRMQPLKQLAVGLAGYDQLQEGLAVLAEYLTGGLGPARLKLLAGRVVAVHAMVQGASFVECYRLLTKDHSFTDRKAFSIAVRVYRGGGFPKDAVYLKGLRFMLGHLRRHPQHLDLLMLGKFGPQHIPLVEDLHYRGILHAPVLPTYINAAARARLSNLDEHMPLTALLDQH
ncbi:MAG TPA: tyrosine/phenylalanine carboxypeptidase domain-containing protein [Flavobacteriales bacterium]